MWEPMSHGQLDPSNDMWVSVPAGTELTKGLSVPRGAVVLGVGVTKPISSVPLFSYVFRIYKIHVAFWISRSYLAGVNAAVTPARYERDWTDPTRNFA